MGKKGTVLKPIAQTRHTLASLAFSFMGIIFFTHALPTPSALTSSFHPALKWSAWLTLLGGGIIFILVNNPFKYTEPGGSISVSALGENGSVYLCIRDDGVGVPDDYKERIFDKFAQGSKADSRPHWSGTGLGLAFCHFVIEAHHGRIWVEDVPGVGSDFVIQLPISQQAIE